MRFSTFAFCGLMFLGACSTDEEPKPLETGPLQEPVKSADPPPNSVATTMGAFTSYAHMLSGKAVVYTDDKKVQTLRLENFSMTSGPDVYVFVSKTKNYSAGNTVPITMLKGSFSNDNLTLTLDDSIDLSTHKFVLVYCVQFSSLFGYAEPK